MRAANFPVGVLARCKRGQKNKIVSFRIKPIYTISGGNKSAASGGKNSAASGGNNSAATKSCLKLDGNIRRIV